MRVDVPGLPEPRSQADARAMTRSDRITCGSTPRTASARRQPARRSPRRPATSSRCRATAQGVFRLRARTEHAARLRHRRSGARKPARSRSRRRHLDVHVAATRRSSSRASPLRFRLLWKGEPVTAVDHRPSTSAAGTRLPAFGRVRAAPHVDRRARARVGRAGLRPRREVRPARQARAARSTRRSRTALGVNTGLSYKNTPFAWGPGTGRGAWGAVRPHARRGHARRRASRLVAPQLRGRRRRRGARPVPVRRRHARRHPRSVHAAHRARAGRCRAGASACGCRARTTRRRSEAVAVGREAARAARFPATSSTLDGRDRVEGRDALQLPVGSRALPRPARGARRDQARTTCACASGSTRTSRSTTRCSPSSRSATTCSRRDQGDPYVFALGHRARARAPSATC